MEDEAIRLTRASLQLGIRYNRARDAMLAGELRGYQSPEGKLFVYRSSLDAYADRIAASNRVPAVA
jgi:hypothetical protein